jgi:putative transposase
MRKVKSTHQAQRFQGGHAAVHSLFDSGRHLVSAEHYQYFRLHAFATWENAAVA